MINTFYETEKPTSLPFPFYMFKKVGRVYDRYVCSECGVTKDTLRKRK